MRIYLAGPMSWIPKFNFPAFDAAELDLLTAGYDVVPPADLHDEEVRKVALASTLGDPADLPRHLSWGKFLAADVEMIADHGIQGISCMDGWEQSRGARLECYVARLCGLPVYRYTPYRPLTAIPTATLSRVFGGVA